MEIDEKIILDHLRQGYIHRCLHKLAGHLDGKSFYEQKTYEVANSINLDTDVFERGFIDSFGLVDLITFIEKTWKIKIPDQLAKTENFRTIRKISEIVNDRLTQQLRSSSG